MNHSAIMLRSVKVIDPSSPHHMQTLDVLVDEDTIVQIGENLDRPESAEEFKYPGCHISPGWMDLRVNFRDPGLEDRENLESGTRAALKGGFTAVALSPETEPPIDSKADIEYLLAQAQSSPLNLYPMGSATRNLEGVELSEMYDMRQAGAVAFGQGTRVFTQSNNLQLALLYNKQLGPYLHLYPQEYPLRQKGVMHEGAQSIWLGMKGIPNAAEEAGLRRDLEIARYCDTGLHFCGISSAGSVKILRQAREEGYSFQADVNLANLLLTDRALEGYDTLYKVYPPLREEADRQALSDAVKEGLITCITSDHQPWSVEDKRCEFQQATFGAASLETFFGALWCEFQGEWDLGMLIDRISHGPRQALGIPTRKITEGETAELTLFDPNRSWSLSAAELESKAANCLFLDRELRGKPLGIINKGMALFWE